MKYFPYFLLLLLSCNSPQTLLPKFEEGWNFARWTEEMSVDGGLVYSQDSSNAGSFVFQDGGMMQWTDRDSMQHDLGWMFEKKGDEVHIDNWIFEVPLGGGTIQQSGLTFKVLESKSDQQLWRAEHQRRVFNPFTQDSGQAIIVVQWKLER